MLKSAENRSLIHRVQHPTVKTWIRLYLTIKIKLLLIILGLDTKNCTWVNVVGWSPEWRTYQHSHEKIEVEEGQRWKDLKKSLLGPEKKNRYNTKRYSIRFFCHRWFFKLCLSYYYFKKILYILLWFILSLTKVQTQLIILHISTIILNKMNV
jgi:hypothetical protein